VNIKINHRAIGAGHPAYIIAEMSANHGKDFNQAVKIIEAAKEAGADAVKLQTYTPDTITIDCDNDPFRIKGTIWEGKNLYQLYSEAYTPWEWQPRLKEVAETMGMDLFSTPFDATAVEFLEKMNVSAYKVASFEVVDLPLLEKIGKTRKPVIMSTGMASLSEIDEAVSVLRRSGCTELVLLKCVSAYPATPQEMNLKTLPNLSDTFKVPVGLSDHSMEISVPVAAVVLGASVIEKHFTLARSQGGPDSSFSLEPGEFKAMVQAVRNAEMALGEICYDISEKEMENRTFRRSLFVVDTIQKGALFNEKNIRSIRPAHGLHTRYLNGIINKKAARDVVKGTPLSWDMVDFS
jgi:pseudaminic acid synthase